ncbi:pyocin knob domain-containing protein [Serratia liquefaciens]|uniref:pyocin knob domain-containing protein n=1 Tax=Serratia liquefaciens TaxID=614 RepID=UPI000FC16378|nr:pyocin knob domain-containing protein [Serratia liquefaciens]
MIIGFGNNVVSSLAADITATQTTIQVMPGAGALFAGLLTYDYANDSNLLKTYAKITLTDAKETVFEVCHLTAVNNDMLTVVRGQEGTAAKGWSLNDVIANFATRGSENQFVQIEQLQSGHYTSAVAGGTANGLTLALPATFFLNGSTDWALKTPLLIYPILNNTGASTLQLTMGGRVMGTYPLVKGSNTALRVGDIVAKNPFLVVFNADQGRFVVLNPTTNVGAVLTVNSHDPDAAGNVKLGTAADADVGKDSPGQVLTVGNYGLSNTLKALADVDLNTIQTFGFYVIQNPVNGPAGSSGGTLFLNVATWQSGTGTAGYRVAQEVIGYGQSGSTGNRVWRRTWTGSVWSGWIELYSEAHKPTAQDTGALPIAGGTITGNLTINGTTHASRAIYINDGSGVEVGSFGVTENGVISVYSTVTGRSFGLESRGNFTTSSGVQILESGARVFSPNNLPPAQSAFSYDGATGYWYDLNNKSGRLIQGGVINRSGEVNNFTFPIAYPGACVGVFITQTAQSGSSSENIIVTSKSNTGFTVVMRSNETQVYWMAIGA